MANQEHLDILREGVWEWNEWREDNPDITVPELGGADLAGMDLSWVNFKGAVLIGVNFSRANLYHADISGGADLSEASLAFANLAHADDIT